jgi:hypothetical protein
MSRVNQYVPPVRAKGLQIFKRIVLGFGLGDFIINMLWRDLLATLAEILEAIVDLNTFQARAKLVYALDTARHINKGACLTRTFEALLHTQMTKIIRQLVRIYESEGNFAQVDWYLMLLQTFESKD